MPYITIKIPGVMLTSSIDNTQLVIAKAWDRSTTHSVQGSIDKFSSGRKVAYVSPGQTNAFEWTFYNLSQEEYDLMVDLQGKLVLMRDRHHRKVWGMYFDMTVVDFRDEAYDISFNFENVTYSEVEELV